MEDKVIGFGKGIHREPSIGEVGELTDCVNMYSEGGEMKIMPRMKTERVLPTGYAAIYIHSNGGVYDHIILKRGNDIGYVDMNSSSAGADEKIKNFFLILNNGEEIYDITSMGNVLVVATSECTYYELWVMDNYINYSLDSLKDLDIQFALSGDYVSKSDLAVTIEESQYSEDQYDTNIGTLTSNRDTRTRGTLKYYYTSDVIHEFTSSQQQLPISEHLVKNEYYNLNIKLTTVASYEPVIFLLFKFKDVEACRYIPIYFSGESEKDIKLTVDEIAKYGFEVPALINSGEIESIYVKVAASCNAGEQDKYFYWGATFTLNKRSGSSIPVSTKVVQRTEGNLALIKERVVRFVKAEATDENKFIFPFYVRYAIKLKSGTYIKPSAPILMTPNSSITPDIYVLDQAVNAATLQVCAYVAKLQYRILNSDALNALKSLTEVVDSIAIAITSPIYTSIQEPDSDHIEASYYITSDNSKSKGYLKLSSESDYKVHNIKDETKLTSRVTIPSYTEDEQLTNFKNACENFYIIKEIKLSEAYASNNFSDLSLDSGILSSLSGRKQLEDNVVSMSRYIPESLYVYNNRLNLANVQQCFFHGDSPQLMMGFLGDPSLETGDSMAAVVSMKKDNIALECTRVSSYVCGDMLWFYYPDADAFQVTLYKESNKSVMRCTLELTKHPMLNGVYWFGSYSSISFTSTSDSMPTVTESAKTPYPNRIIYSTLNNPLTVESNITTVGKGAIQKLVSNTKALSQGQFGEHPIIAFCTDGIWALEIGSDGLFTAIQPLSRDVVSNVKSITQLDNAIAFITDKGLMMLEGSQVRQLCKHMNNLDKSFNVKDQFEKIPSLSEWSQIFINDTNQFMDVLNKCRLVPDYKNSLLWVLPPDVTYIKQYAVSLETGEVYGYISPAVVNKASAQAASSVRHGIAAVPSNFKYSEYFGPDDVIPNYPQPYMRMTRLDYSSGDDSEPKAYNVLATFENQESDELCYGWILTRPIPFDDAYTMKMLYDLKVEKMLTSGDSGVKVAVYVSNDRREWVRAKSLKTGSYKWYRFAVFCTFNDYDRLTGLVCRIDERRRNKIR